MKFPLSKADQIGIIVDDLDSFLEQLDRLLGLRGFEVVEYPPEGQDVGLTYYGEQAQYRLRMAFARIGQFEVEVVQPLEGQSIFQDYLDEHGPGIHHVRFTEEHFDEISQELQDAGVVLMASGRGVHGPSKWAYFDTAALLQGLIIEVKKPAR
jgi:methylmalonyl-CoA/ethylmalonyl-CoA epimerase